MTTRYRVPVFRFFDAKQDDFDECSHYVSITYVDQKSGKEMETRTQVKSEHPILGTRRSHRKHPINTWYNPVAKKKTSPSLPPK
jgi:hypothetical protein